MVTEAMRAAGNQIAADLADASISYSIGGITGSKTWKEFEAHYGGKNMDLLRKYVDEEIDSVTAIYTAMHREVVIGEPT